MTRSGSPLRVADVVAHRIAAAGCRFAFGMPGGEVLTLIDALVGAGLEFVSVRHENAGGFAGEGTWHVDGAPGVLVATLGPGVANVTNVAANALQDAVPLIIFGGRVDRGRAARYTHQVIDHQRLLAPVTKATFEVVGEAAATLIDQAVMTALDDPPGPVFVDLPFDVADAAAAVPHRSRRPAPLATVPAAGAELELVVERLNRAERPLVLAGLHALGAVGAMADFVERLGAPLVTTYKAKGVLPESHPLSLGAAGLSPRADGILLPLIRAADVVVLAGYDPIEMRTNWIDPFATSSRVIEIAPVPPSHRVHVADDLLVGDTAATLALLTSGLESHAVWPDAAPQRVRRELDQAFGDQPEWGPGAIFQTLRAVLRSDAIVTVDTGAHRILLAQMWRCEAPRTLLHSTGLCTMGCALPLAIGAKLAAPERTVVAVLGDGGLDLTLGELATLRDRGFTVPVVVLDDGGYGLIEMKQRARALAPTGVALGPTDYAAVGRALGGRGVRVTARGEFARAVTAALAAPGFTVIHCPIEREAYDGRI